MCSLPPSRDSLSFLLLSSDGFSQDDVVVLPEGGEFVGPARTNRKRPESRTLVGPFFGHAQDTNHVTTGRNRSAEIVADGHSRELGTINPDSQPRLGPEVRRTVNGQLARLGVRERREHGAKQNDDGGENDRPATAEPATFLHNRQFVAHPTRGR
jgi:hypothetical protein